MNNIILLAVKLTLSMPGQGFHGFDGFDDRDMLFRVSIGRRVNVYCSGSGEKFWYSSSGVDIPQTIKLKPVANIIQRDDRSNGWQTLTIQNFTIMDVAVYTCRTNQSDRVSKSLLITNGKAPILPISIPTVMPSSYP